MSNIALDSVSLAHHYEQINANLQFAIGRKLVEQLGVTPRSAVLDVGCGTGRLAELVAEIVGSEGRVIGIDPLPLRIDLARQKSRPNLSFEVAGAGDLSIFPEGTFDFAYLNAVLHWIEDKAKALREVHRVLKPGGRLAIWTTSRQHPNRISTARRRLVEREPYSAFTFRSGGAPYHATAAELAQLTEAAGLRLEKIEVTTGSGVELPSLDAVLDMFESSSFGNFLGHLPADLQLRAREEIKAELAPTVEADGRVRLDGAGLSLFASKAVG